MSLDQSFNSFDSNSVYILPQFAIWQSRAVNLNVPYLDKNSDFGLGDSFLVFSVTSAWLLRVLNEEKARLKCAACKVNTEK